MAMVNFGRSQASLKKEISGIMELFEKAVVGMVSSLSKATLSGISISTTMKLFTKLDSAWLEASPLIILECLLEIIPIPSLFGMQ